MKVFPPSGLILTDGPSDDMSKQAYVIVSIGRGSPEQPDDRARFARDLLSPAPLRDIKPQSAEAMRIGGLPGFEIRAQAEGLNGEPVMVAQWLRFSGGSYLRIVGVGAQGRLGRAVHPLPRVARRDRIALKPAASRT